VQDFFGAGGSEGTTVFGLRYTQLLGRIDSYEHRAAFGRITGRTRTASFSGILAVEVPDITSGPASLTYSGRVVAVGRDLSFNVSTRATFRVDLTAIRRPFSGTLNSAERPFKPPARPGASASTRSARGRSVLAAAAFGFRRARAPNAQHTHNLLVPGEQFGMAADSVRGYYDARRQRQRNAFSLEGYGPDSDDDRQVLDSASADFHRQGTWSRQYAGTRPHNVING